MAKRSLEVELIRSAATYHRALKRLAVFSDTPPRPGSRQDLDLEVLMPMVDKYEAEHFPVPPPDPIAAIRFALEQRARHAADRPARIGRWMMAVSRTYLRGRG